MGPLGYTIVLAGLGGQGLITLLKILGKALMNKGYNVITSETHGLSQRGGNVTCFLRYGKQQYAPIPIIGSTDIIIAMEKSTILNVIKYCKPDKSTKLVISNYIKEIIGIDYPSGKYFSNILKEQSDHIYFVKIHDKSVSNMVILGKILDFVPLNKEEIEDILNELFTGNILNLNLEALNLGILGE